MPKTPARILAVTVLGLAGAAHGDVLGTSGVYVLDPGTSGAISMSGTSTVLSPVVYINSSHSDALKGSGSAILSSAQIDVVGDVSFSGSSGYVGTLSTYGWPEPDPVSTLVAPTWDPIDDLGSVDVSGGTAVVVPGYYSGGIKASGGATLTLDAGVYILDGAGLTVSSSSVEGNGVMLYIIGSGKLSMSGSSSLVLRPPSYGPYAGLSVFQDPANTKDMSLSGGSELQIRGGIYAPSVKVSISGDATIPGAGPVLGKFLVANRVTLSGDGNISIGTSLIGHPAEGGYD